MSKTVLLSPAKLNLFLKIHNKHLDGFHDIVTLFQRIDLRDEISFVPTSDKAIRIVCDHPHVPVGPKNLVYKVAQILQNESSVSRGVQIEIKKRIPVAAGLAGGSSNGATALLGLNQVWSLGLSRAQLLSYARRIGSDVAFFLHDTSWALGTGRGDKIRKLGIKANLWHILVVPHIKMYSGKVYQEFRLPQVPPKSANKPATNLLTKINDDANILTRNLRTGNILEVGHLLSNDLEETIIGMCPRLQKVKERLKLLGAKGVMISGSGPAVFGLTDNQKEAQAIKTVLLKRFSRVFVVRTL